MSTPTENTDRAARRAQMLAELSDMTFSAVKHAHGRLMASETSAEVAETSLAFHRVARALRQTLLLETRFEADAAAQARDVARDTEVQAEAQRARAAEDAAQLRAQRTARVNHEMVRAVMEHAESPEHGEELLAEMRFCLNAWVHGHDWERRSFDELIADFCHDLGIPTAWEEVAREEPADDPDETADETADGAADDAAAADEPAEAEAMAEAAPSEPTSPPPQPPELPPRWIRGADGDWVLPPNSS